MVAATVASVLPASIAFAGWFASGAADGGARAASLGAGRLPTASAAHRI